MKQLLTVFCFLCISLYSKALQYPSEWIKYTNAEYMYDIQSDSNDNNLSEINFKNYLLNIAITNIAKQIQVRVQDVADLNKQSVNGRTSITYSSNTNFSTDVNLKLVETKTTYDPTSRIGYAIAYISREAARSFYHNELNIVYNKVNKSISLAENYTSSGFKAKARIELESSLNLFEQIDEPLFWMNVFGTTPSELNDWQERFNVAEQNVKRKLADLQHGTVIYLSCKADVLGKVYSTLQNELKGILAADGCSFTNDPKAADWIITVTCTTREYSNVKAGNSNSYFSYVDAHIIIDKVITSQRIFEDEISVKGGHTFGYSEAAKVGYKEVKKQIGKIIKENIEL